MGADPSAVTVSAAMIVRNEQRYLGDCLASIAELVDEVIVVDTGSTDSTVDIARSFGVTLDQIDWDDDFAAARNHALDLVTSDWVLYIDADERVRPTDPVLLRTQLADPGLVAANLSLHPQTGFDSYRELRLFRSDPRLRFVGIIHETIWPAVNLVARSDQRHVGETSLVIDHVGYDGPQDHKHERNLPLLRKALAADPDHIYCWYHLGSTLRGLGDVDGAREAWRRGIDVVRRRGPDRPADSLPHIELIRSLMDAGEPFDEVLAEATGIFPDDRMIWWLRGQAALSRGDHHGAIEILTGLVEAPESASTRAFGYDRRLLGPITESMIATAHHLCGDHQAAARHMRRAEDLDPTNIEYRTKRRLFEHLSR